MNNHLQQMNPPAVVSDSVHIIEDEPDERSQPKDLSQEQTKKLRDALTVWQDVNVAVSQVGRFLIDREVSSLKRTASDVSASRNTTVPGGEATANISAASNKACMPSTSPNKRRRVSGFGTKNAEDASSPVAANRMNELLLHKMTRMRRLTSILTSLSDSHIELEKEIQEMLAEAGDNNQ